MVWPYAFWDTELALVYPILFAVVFIYLKFLAGNTFMFLDCSQYAIAFTLTTDGLFVARPRTGPCGCCPQPIPWLYVVREVLATASITEVNVYRQLLVGIVTDGGGGANAGGPTLSYSVDPNSISVVASPNTPVGGRPTLNDFAFQPCNLIGAMAGCGEGGRYAQLFLGAKAGGRLVRLSKPVFSTWLAADAFAKRDKLRAELRL